MSFSMPPHGLAMAEANIHNIYLVRSILVDILDL